MVMRPFALRRQDHVNRSRACRPRLERMESRTVLSPPTVTGVVPTSGPEAGGTSVTISGTNFTTATTVDFGTMAVSSFDVVNDTTITTDSPAATAPGAVDVTVSNPDGTSPTSPADQFTYTAAAAPVVTGLSPTSGPEAGGTLVSITGSGFTGATAVDFGTTAATNVTVVNRQLDHGGQPGGNGHRGRDGDDAGGHIGHFSGRSVHLHGGRRAGRDGPEPNQRPGGRRHAGDDHRQRVHRRDGGRLRHHGGDECHRGQSTTRSRPTARRERARWT